jgi:hypothetical protein
VVLIEVAGQLLSFCSYLILTFPWLRPPSAVGANRRLPFNSIPTNALCRFHVLTIIKCSCRVPIRSRHTWLLYLHLSFLTMADKEFVSSSIGQSPSSPPPFSSSTSNFLILIATYICLDVDCDLTCGLWALTLGFSSFPVMLPMTSPYAYYDSQILAP